MKTTVILILCALLSAGVYAQNEKYMKAMEKTMKMMGKEGIENFQKVANKFEMIAQAEKDKWVPYYYAAFCYTTLCFAEQNADKMDPYLDKAQAYLDKAKEISPDNSELETMQGYIYQARIQVDPMTRGMQYGMMASSSLQKAIQMDPNNPRPYHLMGQSLFYTPEEFGGGKDKACVMFTQADEKFNSFTPQEAFAPDWGKEGNDEMLELCKK